MTDQHEERLRAVIREAVDDVQPRDRLSDLRRRTGAPGSDRTTLSRRWAPVILGAGAVAATVAVATYVVGGLGEDSAPPPDIAGSPPADRAATAAAGIYFVADTPTGPRLFREFQAVTPSADPEERVLVALERLTEGIGPRDPDYRTLWPAESFESVRVEVDRVVVELATAATRQPGGDDVGVLGVQQAVYTAEAALGETLPVTFAVDGTVTRRVLGTTVPALVQRDRSAGVTAPVNITDPTEGLAVDADSFVANGTMSSSVAEVSWSLRASGRVLLRGRATPIDVTGSDARATLGAPGWETQPIDVAGLPAGTYELVASVTDVGQTSDRPVEFVDTRSITVR